MSKLRDNILLLRFIALTIPTPQEFMVFGGALGPLEIQMSLEEWVVGELDHWHISAVEEGGEQRLRLNRIGRNLLEALLPYLDKEDFPILIKREEELRDNGRWIIKEEQVALKDIETQAGKCGYKVGWSWMDRDIKSS